MRAAAINKNQVTVKDQPIVSIYTKEQAATIYRNYKMLLHLYCINKSATFKPAPKAPLWAIAQQSRSRTYVFSGNVSGFINSVIQFFPRLVRGSTASTAHN